MVEYLVTYVVDKIYTFECTVIAKSITHALDLVDVYIKEKNPFLKSSEILSCEFIKKIDTLLVEQP